MEDREGNKSSIIHLDAVNNNRLGYIDNLKALLIIFVVIMHAACTYSGLGSWMYMEHHSYGKGTFYFFLFYESFSGAYFMSLFFMIAAYFIPKSLEKKGVKKFILDRLYRLGVPTLIFIFIINPIWLKMAYPNVHLIDYYYHGIISFNFLSWTGPMWFAAVLLVFSIVYIPLELLCNLLASRFSFDVTVKDVLILIILITVGCFILRLFFPLGTAVLNIQFSNFSAYIFMFFIGIFAYRKNIFDKIRYPLAIRWFIASFAIGIPLWIIVIYLGVPSMGSLKDMTFTGGWNLPSFLYALWESFFCVAIIIALIGIFKEKFNKQNSIQKYLSENAFCVYVFHPLVLTAITVLFASVDWAPILKFAIVTCIAVPTSFIVSSLIRKVKMLRRLFS